MEPQGCDIASAVFLQPFRKTSARKQFLQAIKLTMLSLAHLFSFSMSRWEWGRELPPETSTQEMKWNIVGQIILLSRTFLLLSSLPLSSASWFSSQRCDSGKVWGVTGPCECGVMAPLTGESGRQGVGNVWSGGKFLFSESQTFGWHWEFLASSLKLQYYNEGAP